MKPARSLLEVLQEFVERYCLDRPPCLLGLSGGPDSMALFWLLKELGYPFVVAHVDHSWRKASVEESSRLERLCQKEGVPFFLKKLEPPTVCKNLEDQG